MNDVKVGWGKPRHHQFKPQLFHGETHMPHPTTTLEISEAIDKLQILAEKIHHASFIPQEELVAMLIAGSMVLDTLTRTYDPSMFTNDEIQFITNLCEQISDEFIYIQGSTDE